MGRFRRGTIVVALVVAFVLGAVLATALGDATDGRKTLSVPDDWRGAFDDAHVVERDDVALAWGDRAGADPTTAPEGLRFDPEVVVDQLQALHELDVDELGLGATDGPLAGRKLLVVVAGTWPTGPGAPGDGVPVTTVDGGHTTDPDARPLTRGAVVDGVPVLHVDPVVLAPSLAPADAASAGTTPEDATAAGATAAGATTAAPTPTPTDGADRAPRVPAGTPWELARGVAETLQHLTVAAHPGHGLSGDARGTLRAAGAAYLASVAVPDEHADVADHVAAPHLAWGSPRQGTAGWLLLQHLGERSSARLLADLWTQSLDSEDVLGAYARITSANASALNRRVAQYAMRTAVGDVPGVRGSVLDGLDPVLVVHRTTPVEPADDPGAYRVTGAFAPAAYGYTVVRLVPDGSGADVRVRVRGHTDALTGADPGWSFGLVATGPAGPRYSPVTEAVDGELRLALRPGEDEVYLVVTATPAQLTPVAPTSFERTVRFPYEFRVAGAAVSDPAVDADVAGGHRHPNGGGWVDDAATVDPAAHVAAGAVVRGNATVGPGVRVEGRAWVEAGAQLTGEVVVRDAALVRGSARLSGRVLVGGDAVVGFTCDAGAYTSYRAAAVCDGTGSDTDVNATVTPFAPGQTALSDGVATVAPEPTEVPSAPGTPGDPGAPGASARPSAAAPGSAPRAPRTTPAAPSPSGGVAAPPAAVPAGACTATYQVTTSWPGGMQAQIVVTATTPNVDGWVLSWTQPPGLELVDVWGASFARSGSTVTAENLDWNGSIPDGGSVTFGFNGTAAGEAALTVPQITCTRTR